MLDRGGIPELRVAALTVVEDLEKSKNRVRQIEAGSPFFPVQQLDLHGWPERFHHRVVVETAHCSERGHP